MDKVEAAVSREEILAEAAVLEAASAAAVSEETSEADAEEAMKRALTGTALIRERI